MECKVKVTPYGQWFEQPCSRKATKDGYCTQHHPDWVKKRNDKQREKNKITHANSIHGRHERLQTKLDDLEYRHECLKSMWEDEVNTCPPGSAEEDIDTFIHEEESRG